MYPDEILSPTEGFGAAGAAASLDTEALKQHIEELLKQGDLVKMPSQKSLPVFVLGLVGGALGANMLKGTVGTIAGLGLAWWAYNQLSETR
jgi:hypothetical protein